MNAELLTKRMGGVSCALLGEQGNKTLCDNFSFFNIRIKPSKQEETLIKG